MLGVFLVELLDPARRIHQLLLAGKKGMAGGTDFYIDFFVHGTKFKFAAASAFVNNLVVFGMNVRFHGCPSLRKKIPSGKQVNQGKFIIYPLTIFF